MALSTQQQQVLDWAANEVGSLNLIARAGCGKTFTLMALTEHIVKHGLGEVQMLAYNKSIATELQDKLKAKGIDWKKAGAGTVHSVGFNAWRKVAPNVQVDGKKVYGIVEQMAVKEADPNVRFVCEHHANAVVKAVSMAKQQGFGFLHPIRSINKWWDMVDHFGIVEDIDDENAWEDVVSAGIIALEKSIAMDKEVVDFDDMVIAPLIHKAKIWPKDWVMLDEAQDTNPARRALALALLRPKTGRLVAVGDPAQAIYGFTGASHDSMDQLREALGSKELPLNKTYRCPKVIVQIAQQWVPDIEAMPEAPQGKYRAISYDKLLKEGLAQGDAILCRNTKPLVSTVYTLIKNRIPAYIEGRDIGQGLVAVIKKSRKKTIEDFLNWLGSWAENEMQRAVAKGKDAQIQVIEDKMATLQTIADMVWMNEELEPTCASMIAEINNLFADTKDGEKPRCVVLSTVHKAKGREWKRVYALGRATLMPSKWAKKAWEMQQETNLMYVMVTRSMDEFIDVEV